MTTISVKKTNNSSVEQIPPEIRNSPLFNTPWHLWYHHELDNWKVDGYRKIFTINCIRDFWDLHNNIEYIGGINNQNFFLMRDNINPIWEDPKNRNGGCWSIKLMETHRNSTIWQKLALKMVCENMFKDPKHDELGVITGLSINLRNANTTIIKIWNSDTKFNSSKLLNDDITKDFGYNIIYKKNNVEY